MAPLRKSCYVRHAQSTVKKILLRQTCPNRMYKVLDHIVCHFNGTVKKILLRQTCSNRMYFLKILDHLSHKNTYIHVHVHTYMELQYSNMSHKNTCMF